MSEQEEEDIKQLIDRHILDEIRARGNAEFKPVLMSIVQEKPDLKATIRSEVPYIKKRIEELNAKREEEDPDIDSLELDETEMNEYEELSTLFANKLESDPELKKYVKSLVCYGSYGKGTHLVGQSDINFLLILTDIDDEGTRVQVLDDINTAIEEIMNPLFVHLFDLTILFERDIQNLDKIGTAFNVIHAFSSKEGMTLLGENPFVNLTFKPEDLQEEARTMIVDTITEFSENFNELNYSKKANLEDLAYLSSEAIVNVGLSLCYLYNSKLENVTKPEIKEKVVEISAKQSLLKGYTETIGEAWDYRIGVTIKHEEEAFIKNCIELCQVFEEKLAKKI
ncbi:MAG: hypothetical protein ACFFD4_31755 [Candidatus Odinarchaeota archaeon]